MTNIISKLKRHCEALSRSPDFDSQMDVGLGMPMELIEEQYTYAFNEIGVEPGQYTVPSAVKQLGSLHNGFKIRWQYGPQIEKDYTVMGNIGYADCFAFVTQNVEFEGNRLFLFDDFLDKWRVYIELSREARVHRLFYYNEYENTFLPMNINAEKYIEKTVLCRGMTGWHDFFMEDAGYEGEKGCRKHFENTLPAVFPDVTLEEFFSL